MTSAIASSIVSDSCVESSAAITSESEVERNPTPLAAQLAVQLDGVDQVAVVRERDLALVGAPDGLRVLPRVRAGRRVAHVPDRHLALQRAQLLLVEDLVDEALVAHRHDVAVLGGRDAGRLLAAMLERVEREVGQPGDLLLRRDDAEDAALVTGSFAGVEEGVLVHGRSCTVATRPAAPAPARRNLRGLVRRCGGGRAGTLPRDPRGEICPSTPPSRSTASGSASSSSARRSGSTRRRRSRPRPTSAPTTCSPAASRRPTSCATRGRSTSSAATARRSGTSTATSTSTSTTASARWSRATRTRRSARAIQERYASGTHFAAPTEDAIVVAEELQRRWGLARWRYTNSGSEATMDAIRIARAYTGRDTVMKIFGSYHGHHDTVMVSIGSSTTRSATARTSPRCPTARASRRRPST